MSRLSEVRPEPTTELRHENPYELLVAVILSAQCTDERVNQVSPTLFDAYPDVDRLAAAMPEEVLPLIASISFPNNKARHLVAMAQRVRDEYAGEIPGTVEALQTLQGVGRKTALVVAGVAFGQEGIPVDTHVFRVAHRLGLVRRDARTPKAVEEQLLRVVPAARLTEAHHRLILHGRYTCKARTPLCGECPLTDLCPHHAELTALPPTRKDLDRRRGAFFCATRKHYFDQPVLREDRRGVEQLACPKCDSMNLFESKSGRTTRAVFDPRIH